MAINIVGDSAHSLEAMAPATMDEPIPDGSVKIKMRPVCPAMQPKHAAPQTPWLVCNNVPTSLFAITSGGGTNVEFDYNIYKDEVERKCDPINCMPETKLINVIAETNIVAKEATCTGEATNPDHVCASADFSQISDVNVASERQPARVALVRAARSRQVAKHCTRHWPSQETYWRPPARRRMMSLHMGSVRCFEALTPKTGTEDDCTATPVRCTYTEEQFEYDFYTAMLRHCSQP